MNRILNINQNTPSIHASYQYDAVGSQLQVNSERFYEWDVANQLKFYKNQVGTSTPTVQAQYHYAGGERVKKETKDQQEGGALKNHPANDFSERASMRGREITIYIDGIVEHRYKKNNSNVVTDEQTIIHIMDGRSRIATIRTGDSFGDTTSAIKYNLEDHLGTSTVRLDNTGALIDREEFYPFGDSSLRTFTKKRYRYVGKEKDAESGLYYYGARYYSAWTCRFVSVDPLADKYADLNPYNYAGNKPINKIDIDGLQEEGKKETKTPENNGNNPENNDQISETGGSQTERRVEKADNLFLIPEIPFKKHNQYKGFNLYNEPLNSWTFTVGQIPWTKKPPKDGNPGNGTSLGWGFGADYYNTDIRHPFGEIPFLGDDNGNDLSESNHQFGISRNFANSNFSLGLLYSKQKISGNSENGYNLEAPSTFTLNLGYRFNIGKRKLSFGISPEIGMGTVVATLRTPDWRSSIKFDVGKSYSALLKFDISYKKLGIYTRFMGTHYDIGQQETNIGVQKGRSYNIAAVTVGVNYTPSLKRKKSNKSKL